MIDPKTLGTLKSAYQLTLPENTPDPETRENYRKGFEARCQKKGISPKTIQNLVELDKTKDRIRRSPQQPQNQERPQQTKSQQQSGQQKRNVNQTQRQNASKPNSKINLSKGGRTGRIMAGAVKYAPKAGMVGAVILACGAVGYFIGTGVAVTELVYNEWKAKRDAQIARAKAEAARRKAAQKPPKPKPHAPASKIDEFDPFPGQPVYKPQPQKPPQKKQEDKFHGKFNNPFKD